MHGPTCILRASLTPFSFQAMGFKDAAYMALLDATEVAVQGCQLKGSRGAHRTPSHPNPLDPLHIGKVP